MKQRNRLIRTILSAICGLKYPLSVYFKFLKSKFLKALHLNLFGKDRIVFRASIVTKKNKFPSSKHNNKQEQRLNTYAQVPRHPTRSLIASHRSPIDSNKVRLLVWPPCATFARRDYQPRNTMYRHCVRHVFPETEQSITDTCYRYVRASDPELRDPANRNTYRESAWPRKSHLPDPTNPALIRQEARARFVNWCRLCIRVARSNATILWSVDDAFPLFGWFLASISPSGTGGGLWPIMRTQAARVEWPGTRRSDHCDGLFNATLEICFRCDSCNGNVHCATRQPTMEMPGIPRWCPTRAERREKICGHAPEEEKEPGREDKCGDPPTNNPPFACTLLVFHRRKPSCTTFERLTFKNSTISLSPARWSPELYCFRGNTHTLNVRVYLGRRASVCINTGNRLAFLSTWKQWRGRSSREISPREALNYARRTDRYTGYGWEWRFKDGGNDLQGGRDPNQIFILPSCALFVVTYRTK